MMNEDLEASDAARRLMHLQTENFHLTGDKSIMEDQGPNIFGKRKLECEKSGIEPSRKRHKVSKDFMSKNSQGSGEMG